jgi:hypothetical protein
VTRSTDHDAEFEADLAALVPAAPSADLRRRIAEALDAAPAVRPAPSAAPRPPMGRWLAERLLWACAGAGAGALAASVAFSLRPAAAVASGDAAAPPLAAATPLGPARPLGEGGPPVPVGEEAVAWADGGVQFLDDRTPARVLRRVAIERYRPVGGAEYSVPREDVILLPVALR